MIRNIFLFSCLALTLVACKPTAHQQKLIGDIEKSLAVMEQEVAKFEGTAEYLSKEQAEFDEINAKLKKERRGKVDSIYSALTKEHRKVVDAHSEKLEKAKTALDGMKSLLEKLRQPLNFTHSAELIDEDFTTYDVMYVEAKPTLEASMEEHEKVEKSLKARLKDIETEKLAAESLSLSPKKESPKSSPKSNAQKK
jgi:predicted RNase H-like nuclease (RuvC/YqgF family)